MIPEVATTKLAALVQAAEDAKALAFVAKERAGVLEGKVIQLHNAHGSVADIERAMQQAEQAQELQQQRYRAWQQQEELLTRVKAWLTELPRGTQLETVPAPVANLNGAPSVVVAEIRTKIGKLVSEHHAIQIAGPTP